MTVEWPNFTQRKNKNEGEPTDCEEKQLHRLKNSLNKKFKSENQKRFGKRIFGDPLYLGIGNKIFHDWHIQGFLRPTKYF